jgi:hypothetical protein
MALTSDATVENSDGTIRLDGKILFPTAANQPAPLASPVFTGTVTLGATVKASLPTADPHVAGQLWANAGVVTVSAG